LAAAALIAAIDLGSNSFRLEVCKVERGQLLRVEYLKDTVRLGAGLDAAGRLDEASMNRGYQSRGPRARWPPRRCARPATAMRSCRKRGRCWACRST
jgi:hypothetical protein